MFLTLPEFADLLICFDVALLWFFKYYYHYYYYMYFFELACIQQQASHSEWPDFDHGWSFSDSMPFAHNLWDMELQQYESICLAVIRHTLYVFDMLLEVEALCSWGLHSKTLVVRWEISKKFSFWNLDSSDFLDNSAKHHGMRRRKGKRMGLRGGRWRKPDRENPTVTAMDGTAHILIAERLINGKLNCLSLPSLYDTELSRGTALKTPSRSAVLHPSLRRAWYFPSQGDTTSTNMEDHLFTAKSSING